MRAERRGPIELTGDHPGMLIKLEAKRVFELAENIIARYVHEEIDAAYIVYNEFKSVIAQRVVVERLLPHHRDRQPADCRRRRAHRRGKRARRRGRRQRRRRRWSRPTRNEADEEAKKFGTANVDYIYEQPPEELFNGLLPQYISSMLYHAMTESVAAEHAARMTAMDAATNNASDMIDAYTLQMNRVRQAAITKEIIEIVSGAAAV